MFVAKLQEKEVDFEELDNVIRKYIPAGFAVHKNERNLPILEELYCKDKINLERARKSIGTLGGGNHFVELDQDKDGAFYLVVHTGSRHLGVEVCNHYQDKAVEDTKYQMMDARQQIIQHLKEINAEDQIQTQLKLYDDEFHCSQKALSYITTPDLFLSYLHDMQIVQYYAKMNREAIVYKIIEKMKWAEPISTFHTVHNYIDSDGMILRKGAVRALKDEMLLIPMNMRDGSLLCKGKGNPDWNYSAPHGAGRIMSRGQAKEKVSLKEFQDSMKDVYTTSVYLSTIDESPMAYKPMESIVSNIGDTVEILEVIKPVYNFKASE